MTITEKKRLHSPHQPVGRWIRPAKRLEIYWRDDWRCLVCGCDLSGSPRRYITLDHWMPLEHGGTNHASNLYTSCRRCNSRRGACGHRPFSMPAHDIGAALGHPLNPVLDRRMRQPSLSTQ